MIRPVPDESCMIQNKIGEMFQCRFAGVSWPTHDRCFCWWLARVNIAKYLETRIFEFLLKFKLLLYYSICFYNIFVFEKILKKASPAYPVLIRIGNWFFGQTDFPISKSVKFIILPFCIRIPNEIDIAIMRLVAIRQL